MYDDDNNNKIFIFALILVVLFQVIPYIFWIKPARADNQISIDQVGSYNTVIVTQDGTTQSATINLGKTSAVDNTYVNITQQGTGAKTAGIEIPSGYNNSVVMFQDGAGNHNASIQNLNGSANNINFSQTGAGNHSFNVIGGQGTNNSGNTIDATQSGGAGADKSFQLNLNGTNGANVSIQQTNPTQSNSGSMSIQCYTGCGNYSYTRN